VLVFYQGDPRKVFALEDKISEQDWAGVLDADCDAPPA
jgi:hypothetical protein